jgi:hypothetical protein
MTYYHPGPDIAGQIPAAIQRRIVLAANALDRIFPHLLDHSKEERVGGASRKAYFHALGLIWLFPHVGGRYKASLFNVLNHEAAFWSAP